MKKLLVLLLALWTVMPIGVRAADWMEDFLNVTYQMRRACGYDTASTSFVTDTGAHDYIREGIVAVNTELHAIEVVHSVVTTYKENSYALDSILLGMYSVEWTSVDSVKTLMYVPREAWGELFKDANSGQSQALSKRPTAYDYSHDSIFVYPTPLKAGDTLKITGWAKVQNLATTDSLAELQQSYRLAVLKYATWQAALAKQHPATQVFQTQWERAMAALKVSFKRGAVVEPTP